MKLSTTLINSAPVLLQLDDSETIERYGEPLDFWISPVFPVGMLIKWQAAILGIQLAERSGDANKMADALEAIIHIFQAMLLDEDGTPLLKDGVTLREKEIQKATAVVADYLKKKQL